MLDIRTQQSALQQRFNEYYASEFVKCSNTEELISPDDAAYRVIRPLLSSVTETPWGTELANFFSYYEEVLNENYLYIPDLQGNGLCTIYAYVVKQFVKDHFNEMMDIARRAFDENMH